MGLFNRMFNVIRYLLGNLISSAETPEMMLTKSLVDLQEKILQFKRQLATAIADEKKLIRQYEEERGNAVHWEHQAIIALQENDEELALQALEKQAYHIKLSEEFENNWRPQHQAVEQLKTAILSFQEQFSKAQRQKNLLVARARRAEAQKNISETLSDLKGNDPLGAFSKVEEKVNQMEAEADAAIELSKLPGDHLSSKFEKLTTAKKQQESLSTLQSKLKLLKQQHNIQKSTEKEEDNT